MLKNTVGNWILHSLKSMEKSLYNHFDFMGLEEIEYLITSF